MPGLADLQDWMQAAILDGAPARAPTRAHVRGDNRLGAEARLAIYASGYRQRLLECLRTEYPVLTALAGPTAFDLFAQSYIAAHPSRSYTLYDFGACFAEHLDATRPAGDGTPQTVEAIPAALARIERAKAEVLRARGIEGIAPAETAAGLDPVVAGLLGLGATAYRRPDSLRLLSLPFDFAETLAAAERNEAPPLPRFAPSFVAVARARYCVTCHHLEPWQYDWLSTLPDTTAPAGPARPTVDPRLAAWRPFAVDQGLAMAVGQGG